MPISFGQALIGAAALCVAGAGQAAAFPMGGMKNVLSDIPGPAPGVTASAVWPDNADSKVLLGSQRVKVLMGFRNWGDVAYNLTLISGSLNLPGQFSQYVQNLTTLSYGLVIPPKEEITVPYMLMPAHNLPPQDFTVALTAFYYSVDGQQMYANTFFNDTITFVENTGPFDYQLFFMIATVLALAVGIYVITVGPSAAAVGTLKKLGSKGSSSSRSKESAPAGNKDDWLQGTAYAADQKRKAQPKKTASERKKEEEAAKKAEAEAKKRAAAEKKAAEAASKAGGKKKK